MYKEVGFGVDNFGKPKVYTTKESLPMLIKKLLFLRPGQIPSQPYLGINIRKYLYSNVGDEDLATLKEQIAYQCSDLIPFIDMSGILVSPLEYRGKSSLFIIIPLNIDNSDDDLVMGITKDTEGRIIFDYKFENVLS